MNTRVKTEVAPESGRKTYDCVLAALGLQAAMPKTAPGASGEHWVASWRFCQS